MRIIKIISVWLCLLSLSYALQSEHLLWEKVPLEIELPINKERLIQFPQAIKIIDQNLPPTLEVLKVKESVYLKAGQAFKKARIIVQLIPKGEVIILNLNANSQYQNITPIAILSDELKDEHKSTHSHYEYNAIQLTRFAIQALYAPVRVQQMSSGVYRTPMQTQKTITLFYGASIEAHPIASWRSSSLYVTAVELKNLLNKPITLKPDNLIGQWQSASFYPLDRLPGRQSHASSTVFLVSDTPFHQALNQHIRYRR